MQRFLVSCLFAMACAAPAEKTSAPTDTANKKPTEKTQAVSAEVKKTICASEFGGGMASIEVFRDASSEVKLLALRPDISRFSHAPWTYYSPSGELLLTVPERPMSAEEREKDPVIQKMDELKKGLKADERGVSCE